MPTPPNVGVVAVCHRSALGAALSRAEARGDCSSARITRSVTGSARNGAAMLTGRKGKGRLFALCAEQPEGEWPLRRLVPDDDVPRPLPLPRALRQPLPPRPARQVQGLGARPRLVARAPDRADARLPARLQRHAGDPDHGRLRPLLALPARRPARVGLLRDLAPVGVTQPAREREPDPQGSLSAPARCRSRWSRRSSSASR